MKMKWKRLVLAGAIFSALFAGTAFGGTWLKGEGVNQDRWWYANEDGTYANNGWFWIDGNNDGIAESYCFDAQGWLYANTTTPDGFAVNEAGAWVSEGQVMTQAVEVSAAAPDVESATDSISGTYYHTRTERWVETWEVHSWGDLFRYYSESVTITAIDGETIHLVFGPGYPFMPTGTYVLKKNGDIYEYDSYIGSETINGLNRFAEKVRFDGNKVEVGSYNAHEGSVVRYEIFQR